MCWCGAFSLTRGRICCLQWLLAQSFSGPSPMGLTNILVFYCLRFETSLFVPSYDSRGYGGGIRPILHTGLLAFGQSQSHFTTGDLPPISSSWRQAPWDSRSEFSSIEHLRSWICRLRLLLALASVLILRSESRRTHEPHFTVSDSRLPQPGAQVHIHQEQGGPVIPPRHWVPFSSLFTTRRARVEVIRILLHTLEGQSVMPWHINSRRTENKT
jgi:hypothetical protein